MSEQQQEPERVAQLEEAIRQARALLSRLPHMRDQEGPCIPCVRCALDKVLSRPIDEPVSPRREG